MPTVTLSKLQKYIENVHEKVFNLGSDTLQYAFTNTAPNSATNGQLSDLVEVSYTNFSSRAATTTSSAQTSGTYKLILADLTISFTGSVGPFQYVYLYSNTATNKELICYYDLGSAQSFGSGDTLVIDNDNVNGVFSAT